MANLPQVGLEAVIAGMSQFNAAAGQITKAFDAINNKSSSIASSVSADFVGLGQGVLRFGALAGGAALVGVAALGAGIAALGASALQEVAKFERMELSITNLVAREISGGQLIEQSRQTRIQLTERESKELEKLKVNIDNEVNDREVLSARIEEQKEKVRQLTEQYGDQGLVVIKERAELQGMQLDLEDLSGEITTHQGRISELTGKQGELVTTLEKVRVGQMSMSDAMAQATPRAQELIKWIQLLAIQSPFTSEGIQAAFQTALAYGFTTEQAQRLTEAEVDFVAATGKTAESANLIALALGQIQSRGKLSAQELRQLSEQGVGTNRILEDMGFSLDDVTNGLVDTDVFIEAVLKDMEVFKGAAKGQATTFSGLISSLSEIKSVGLREFFTGTFEAIRPSLATFVNFLTDAALQTGDIRALGDALGQNVAVAIEKIAGWIRTIQTLGMGSGLTFFTQMFGPQGIDLWGQVSDLIDNISASFTDMGTSLSSITPILSQLAANIIPAITEALTFVNEHFEEFKGALLGIGGVLAIGVFAALVAGILSLLTPINLIIAGAALLGAAWVGNWGGIQEKTFAVWAVVQPILMQLGQWLSVNLPVAIQATVDFWNNTLIPALVATGTFFETVIIPAFTQFTTFLQGTVIPAILQFALTLQTNILTAVQMVVGFWNTSLIPAFVNTVTWLTNLGASIQFVATFWSGIFMTAITTVGNFISDTIFPLFESFANLQNAVLLKAGEALAGLWQNILLPAFIAVANFVNATLTIAFNALVALAAQKLGPTIRTLAAIWQNVLLPGITSVGNIIRSLVTPAFEEVGEKANVIGPILQVLADVTLKSIESGFNAIASAIKSATDLFNNLADAVRNFELPDVLTPGSPPPFAFALMDIAKAAQRAAMGLTGFVNAASSGSFDQLLGIDRTITDPLRIAGAAFDDLEKHLDRILGGGKGKVALDLIKPIIKGNLAAIMASANPMAAIQNLLKTSGINFEKLGLGGLFSDKGGVGNVFWASFMENMDEAKAALQEMFIEAGRTAITIGQRLTGVIGGAVDVLNSRVERLQGLVAAGGGQFEGRILDAVQAQQLLNEALEDQAAIQDDILATKENEQKLNFLQQQLDLFDTIKAAGLDVGDVLGGLTLGLDASIPDLIAATNAVIEAMINQVNADLETITGTGADIGDALIDGAASSLGISSPSKVMKALADNTMGSFLNQMLSWGPAIASAGAQAIAGPSLVAAPAMAGAGGSQTTIHANFGGNSISSGMDEAQFDSMVLRSIQRLMR